MKLIAIEILVGFGVPLVWAIWQLVSVRRELRRDKEAAAQKAVAQPSTAHTIVGQKAASETNETGADQR